jgi:hypothetical protein
MLETKQVYLLNMSAESWCRLTISGHIFVANPKYYRRQGCCKAFWHPRRHKLLLPQSFPVRKHNIILKISDKIPGSVLQLGKSRVAHDQMFKNTDSNIRLLNSHS